MPLLDAISSDLGLPVEYLRKLVDRANFMYKKYRIRKRSGGFRQIAHPAKPLKLVQRWLVDKVVSSYPVHESVYSYRGGLSILDNAKVHQSSRYLLRLDIEHFFESIERGDLGRFFGAGFEGRGWGVEDLRVFCKLVCRDGSLPMGAPSSPAISNVILYEVDSQIFALCDRMRIRYSRYADDMFFSSKASGRLFDVPEAVREILASVNVPSGLSLNDSKTLHLSRRVRRCVTGIVLSSQGRACLGRERKRRLRAWIHRWESQGEKERLRIAGFLAFALGVEPGLRKALVRKYGKNLISSIESFPATVSRAE